MLFRSRAVLREFGRALGEELAALVTRDAMIGVARVGAPATPGVVAG